MNNARISGMLLENKLDSDEKIHDMLCSTYAESLLGALKTLETGRLYRSRIHGQGHIERVMLLGAVIAKTQKLSRHEEELLLFCCSYHDIGRVDDSKDDLHGRRSAQMIVDTGLWERFGEGDEEELKSVQAAICTHSLNDGKLGEIALEFGVKDEYMPLCRKLCFCLKDADNLDRVRLHDLDPRHLRHKSSRELIATAEYIYSYY